MRLSRKINALIFTMLTATTCVIVSTTADLFTGDFTQFLYKGTLDAAGLISSRVQSQMRYLAGQMATLAEASFEDFRYPEDKIRFIEDHLTREPYLHGLTLLKNTDQATPPTPVWHIGKEVPKEEFEHLERQFPLALDAIAKGSVEFRMAKLKNGTPTVRMGVPIVRAADGSFSYLMVAELKYGILRSFLEEATDFTAFLVNPSGEVLATSDESYFAPGENIASSSLFQMATTQGASMRQKTPGKFGETQIGAFHPVGFANLVVLTQISEQKIESGKKELFMRTALLGGALLCFALSIGLLFSRAISNPVRALSAAAHQVARGDFTIRVKAPIDPPENGDEIKVLSHSFNFMTGKIAELMTATAQKARMEKELETAKALQQLFIPNEGLDHANLKLSGKLVPASECGGDWWNHAVFAEHLIVVVGDVTGHGAAAALLTSAAQGAFSLFLDDLRIWQENGQLGPPEVWLRHLCRQINAAVLGAGRTKVGIALSASVIGLRTGRALSVNFGNRVPFLFRASSIQSADPQIADLTKAHIPLAEGFSQLLGEVTSPKVEIFERELSGGDVLLWYTDGLVEARDRENDKAFGKKRLLNFLATEARQELAEPICTSLMNQVQKFAGGAAAPADDDITLVVAKIPINAAFTSTRAA